VKAISLTQPYATLVATGQKRIETRSWQTSFRGPLLIHAAKSFPDWARERAAEWAEDDFGLPLADELPLGALLAAAVLIDCVPTEEVASRLLLTADERAFGDYDPGRWAWVMTDVIAFPQPVPWRGALGLWTCEYPGIERWLAARGWPHTEEETDGASESDAPGAVDEVYPGRAAAWPDPRQWRPGDAGPAASDERGGSAGDDRPRARGGDADRAADAGDGAARGEALRPLCDPAPLGRDREPDDGVADALGRGGLRAAGEPSDGRIDGRRPDGSGDGPAGGVVAAEAAYQEAKRRWINANERANRLRTERAEVLAVARSDTARDRAGVAMARAGRAWTEKAAAEGAAWAVRIIDAERRTGDERARRAV
jgi:hypothetical protein